jgi:hypothetical protein
VVGSLERIRAWLPLLAVVAAGLCVAELFWLRTAELAGTRFEAGVLFLPWLLAAATNLGLWYFAVASAQPSPIRRLSGLLLRVVAGVFALGFAGLYGGLIFGWF